MNENNSNSSDFSKLIKNNLFYIDKTLFIKDFFDHWSNVIIINRPIGFGKSLTINTLNSFLNNKLDSRKLFEGLNISKYPDILDEHLNKYPVILLDLKSVVGENYTIFHNNLVKLIANLYEEFARTHDTSIFMQRDQIIINKTIKGELNCAEIRYSLYRIISLFYEYYNQKVVLLIDGYDEPLREAYSNGYHKRANSMLVSFYSIALDHDEYIRKSLIIGCSIVTGYRCRIENMYVHTIEEKGFSQYFGFTEDEVKLALKKYHLSDTFDEVKDWYGGYKIGNLTLFNPLSVAEYIKDKEFKSHMIDISSFNYIKNSIRRFDHYQDTFSMLISGDCIYGSLTNHISHFFGFFGRDSVLEVLYQFGYLKKPLRDTFCAVNKEVIKTLEKSFKNFIFSDTKLSMSEITFLSNLINFNYSSAARDFENLIWSSSCTTDRHYYAILDRCYYTVIDEYDTVRKDRFSERSEFILKNKISKDIAYIIKIKRTNPDVRDNITEAITEAFEEIETNKRYRSLIDEGYINIYRFAIVIDGTNVYVKLNNN